MTTRKTPGRKPSRWQIQGCVVTDESKVAYVAPNPSAAKAYLALCRALRATVEVVEVQS